MSDLIDTTEMYLRTIFELSEEGVVPMRARIAERLSQSGPTVSQTVARMQRDGLVELDSEDRHIVLTATGSELATRVMRKHRLAEVLLVKVIGLPWEEVHTEACRWEHVMSDAVERRLVDILGHPTESPFGNPIPGLADVDPTITEEVAARSGVPLSTASLEESPRSVRIQRIGETLQASEETMAGMRRAGAMPGQDVQVLRRGRVVQVGSGDGVLQLPVPAAAQVIVAVS